MLHRNEKSLRIIAGERRGWRIDSPRGRDVTRPITDRVKENLFNIIQGLVPDAIVLDLFAGTGSMGLEALSRGANWVTFVEQHHEVAAILKSNVAKLRYETASRVIHGDALRLRPSVRDSGRVDMGNDLVFDLVFLDPPYPMLADELMRAKIGETLAELSSLGALAADATIIVRRESRTPGQYDWPGFELTRSRPYGSMTLDFLRPMAATSTESPPTQ
jgi:16S rRNA (guanine966-N2)-methyltransferase